MANDIDKLYRDSIGTTAISKILAEDAARRKQFDGLVGFGGSNDLIGNSIAQQLANDVTMGKVAGLTKTLIGSCPQHGKVSKLGWA